MAMWIAFALNCIRMKNIFFLLDYQSLLLEAEKLHQSALKITIEAFGEVNVQTAKHYGNLGRLYQSMGKYQVSAIQHTSSVASDCK